MSSAYRDARGWIAEFKGVGHQPGDRQRRVRVPLSALAGAGGLDDQRASAVEFARSLEESCRALERIPSPADVRLALEAGAITNDQAKALLSGQPVGPAVKPRVLTLQAAAEKHPATQRMPLAKRWNYFRWLADFERFSGITTCKALTMESVQRYLAHREKEGDAYDTRRHRLLFVRRAARYGTTIGIPDPLAGFKLDKQRNPPRIAVYTLAELGAVAVALEAAEMWQELAAVGLGAGVGLSPSETFRVDLSHLEGDILETGEKNRYRQRKLPLPPKTVLAWVRKAAGRRKAGPLFVGRYGNPFNEETWPKWIRRGLSSVGRPIKAKELRKTFATWTARAPGIDKHHVEAFLGHDDGDLAQVTTRHYLADWKIEELRPTARRIDEMILEAMAAARASKDRADSA